MRRNEARRLQTVIALSLLLATPTSAIECRHQSGDDGSWSWRMIDGQKCWYEGRRVLPKDQLQWPGENHAAQSSAGHSEKEITVGHRGIPTTREAAPSWLERVSDKGPPAEIYFLSTVNGRRPLEAYPALIWRQPWLSPDSIMHWPLLIDIDRVPFTAWTNRIGQ